MSCCRVGLVSPRSGMVEEVAALVAGIGGELVVLDLPQDPWPTRIVGGGRLPLETAGVEVLLVDIAADPDAVLVGARVCLVVCREAEQALATEHARRLGAEQIVALPEGRAWLQGRLADQPAGSPLVGVMGAVGGCGASTVAIALAVARGVLLVDLDPDGAGVDLPLGLESSRGIRWENLPADARGPLDPESLLSAVPRYGAAAVLSGAVPEPGLGPVPSVLATARTQESGAVLDLGRRDRHGALGSADWAVLVVPSTVAGVVAARRVLGRTPARVALAVRDSGWITGSEVEAELGVASVVRVPTLRRAPELSECGQLLSGATGRALQRLGSQLAELLA